MAQELKVKITGDVSSLKSELGSGAQSVDKFGNSTEKAGKKTSGLNSAMGGALPIAAAAAGAAIGAAVVKLAMYTSEAGKVAAESERLGIATNSLAVEFGETGQSMIDSITSASKGTISEMDAMRAANSAMMFGVVANAEEMGQLTEIAVGLGRAMGQDATKSLDDMTLAMGRQSRMILDNLGIIVDTATAYKQYAEDNGKVAAALTDTEKKQAFMNAALAAGQEKMLSLGGVINDTQSRTEKFGAASSNFKVAWGDAWNSFGIGVGATSLATMLLEEATYSLKDANEEGTEAVDEYAEAQENATEKLAAMDDGTRDLMETQAKFLIQQEKDAEKLTKLNEKTADKKMKLLNDLNTDVEALNKQESDALYQLSLQNVSNAQWEAQKIKDGYAEQRTAAQENAQQRLSDLTNSNSEARKEIEDDKKKNDILFNLTMMEREGTLERATKGMATTAGAAMTLIEADILQASAAMEKEIPDAAKVAELAVFESTQHVVTALDDARVQADETAGSIGIIGMSAEQAKKQTLSNMQQADAKVRESQGFLTRFLNNIGVAGAGGSIFGSGSGGNFASGGSFIIPAGFGGDTFGLGGGNMGSSGEVVTVQPSQTTNNVTQNNNFAGGGGQSMSMAMLQSMVLN